MADRFYGMDRGETAVTVDTSTTGKDVEIVVDDAVDLEKADIVKMFPAFTKAILEDEGFTEGG